MDWDRFLRRTPLESQNLQFISDLARLISGWGSGLYGVGMPAYEAAINYYRALLGPSKSAAALAIAPQGELIGEVYRGAQRDIEGMPRGGARDQALAELARSRAGQIGSLIPQAQQGAAAASGQLGLAGVQTGIGAATTGAGLAGEVVGLEATNRFAGLSAFLQNKGLDLQRLLGLRSLDIQEMLGLESISVQREGLAQANSQFQQSFGLQQGYFDWYRQFQTQQLQQQQRQASGQKWGSLIGTGLGFAFGQPGLGAAGGAAGGGLVDRMKAPRSTGTTVGRTGPGLL